VSDEYFSLAVCCIYLAAGSMSDPELGEDEYERLLYGANYKDLQAVKAMFDPHDMFRFPQSIRLPS
jgi:hypothetical protein